MNVEINGLSGRSVQSSSDKSQVASSSAAKESPSSSAQGASERNDTVNLTHFATNLQALANEIAKLPVVDTQIVSAVQTSLNTGKFEFEPIKAADNLITQERELAQLETHE